MTAQTGVYVNQNGSWVKVIEKDLVLEFNTNLATTTIEVFLAGTVNCTVDWGDGSSDNYTEAGSPSHTYAAGGTYTVRISGLLTDFNLKSNPALTRCLSFGEVGLTSLRYGFFECSNLVSVPKYLPRLSKITNMDRVFMSCTSFNQDLDTWDVSEVTEFLRAFYGATQFNGNIESWNTSSATRMKLMFAMTSSFNQDLSGWCVPNITTRPSMFDYEATAWTKPRPVWGTCP